MSHPSNCFDPIAARVSKVYAEAMVAYLTQGMVGEDLDFEETWKQLETSFLQIHTKNASTLSYEQLYRFAYRLVLKKKGAELYIKVTQLEQDWLYGNVRVQVQDALSPSLLSVTETNASGPSLNERRTLGERFLKTVKDAWQEHQVCMAMLSDVLMYLVKRGRHFHLLELRKANLDPQDRVYSFDSRKPSIYLVSLGLFRDKVLGSRAGSEDGPDTDVLAVVINVMLEQIQMERSGDIIDKSILKACTTMLENLFREGAEGEADRLYNLFFEPQFLAASRDFYGIEGEKLLRELDAGSFARHTVDRINEEVARCRSTLSENTGSKIETVVNEVLISEKLPEAIKSESGVRFMVDNERYSELKDIFELEGRIDTKRTNLTKAVQQRIVELGLDINKAVTLAAEAPAPQPTEPSGDKPKVGEKPKSAPVNQHTLAAIKWVQDVLLLKEKFDVLWKKSFDSDRLMQSSLTRSFSEFINSVTFNRSSEYVSLYIDDNMRKHVKTMTEDEVDSVLQKAITLLKYIQDKDMFERYYKKHLSRRLLMDKSASIEIEKQMVGRMKIELGNTFTSKMEGMFKDMTISDELTANYRDYMKAKQGEDSQRIDLKIQVLTSMTWPTEMMERISNDPDSSNQIPKINFSPEIGKLKSSFENFYSQKHSGRRLTWLPQAGNADIKARLPSKKAGKEFMTFEYNVSTYAMMVLLLFNDLLSGESLGFDEIQARTNIPDHELVRNLQSLAVAPSTRILRKEPMSRDVKPTDKFYFNESFTPRAVKIKVGVVAAGSKVETDRERIETEKRNDGSRQYVIEAAIVRIMKYVIHGRVGLTGCLLHSRQRKTLDHSTLIAETISQLAHTFKPDVPMIKGRIESLIEREYIERVENADPPAYRYLA